MNLRQFFWTTVMVSLSAFFTGSAVWFGHRGAPGDFAFAAFITCVAVWIGLMAVILAGEWRR